MMTSFWTFARRMLRYRGLLVASLAMAMLAATSLGAGMLGTLPVLDSILGGRKDLPTIARELRSTLESSMATRWISIPDAWIDALPADRPFTAVVVVMCLLGIVTIVGGLANFLHQYFSLTIVQRTVADIRREAFHRVVRLPLRHVLRGGTADTISRIVNDSTTLMGGLSALVSKVVAQVSKGIAGFLVALVANWQLTLVIVPVSGVVYVVLRALSKRIRRASRRALESQAGLYGAAAEALGGLRVVKVHTTERYEAGRFHRLNKRVMREMLRARTARAIASPLVEVLAVFMLGGLTLFATKWIIDNKADPKDFMLAIAGLFVAGASFKPVSGLMTEIQAAAAAADRIAELLRAPAEPGHDPALPRLPRHAESVEFDGVTFTYPGADRPALRDITLRIERGRRVAVVGPNGCGKTTLLSLVPRLFDPDPGRGAVRIDGRDLREVSVRSVRRQIGVVTQETVLFRGTIRANIAYGAEDASLSRIEDAARRARAHEFIQALPGGYDAEVGEQGLNLSGGQRQRLAIARALLRDPAILILDEATSMVDADSEAAIAAAIAEFTRGRTCLIVAHRLSTVASADEIVVMDGGAIVDRGSHQQLLDRCELYRTLSYR